MLSLVRSLACTGAVTGGLQIGMDMAKFSNLLQTVHNANGKTFTVENFLEHDAKPFVLSSYEVLAENAKLVRVRSKLTPHASHRALCLAH